MNQQQSNELNAREKALYAQVQDQTITILDLREAYIALSEKFEQAKKDNAELEKKLNNK
ncbi:hypothetical protein [Staphylococcus agnetis]|uniref:hypothetical protein n=1 Tax=Staphylococcus agnetis TaxID=985762 RepID=UPI0021CF66BC|nr:hypothetical protein [Staphylococcus agnetis]UXU58987.1 hypothetical protein MUA97_08840 [Staphylococcus agnetis]UXU61312.1 hypothetical protein MUA43_08840 [Staphylococcus agnetis]